jgi:mevalonate kinase
MNNLLTNATIMALAMVLGLIAMILHLRQMRSLRETVQHLLALAQQQESDINALHQQLDYVTDKTQQMLLLKDSAFSQGGNRCSKKDLMNANARSLPALKVVPAIEDRQQRVLMLSQYGLSTGSIATLVGLPCQEVEEMIAHSK